MIGNNHCHLQFEELRALMNEREEITQSTYSPETKARKVRNIDKRAHDLMVKLLSHMSAAMRDAPKDDGNPEGHREATEMDFRHGY